MRTPRLSPSRRDLGPSLRQAGPSLRQAGAIAARDVRSILGSAFGVGLAAGFACLSGVLVILDLRGNQARLDSWFGSLYVAVGLLAALLTMRSFAERERTGELELLLTAPVRTWQVVGGKLAGALVVVVVMVACTVGCPILVATMGRPDAGPIITGYVGLLAVAVAFVATGLAVSASTANPLVSAVGTAGLLLALWFGGLLGGGLTGRAKIVLDDLSPATHVTGYLRGTLGIADACYFASFAALGVAATILALRWRR